MQRVALACAALVGVCLSLQADAATNEARSRWHAPIERTARASAALGRPVGLAERHPALRLFAHVAAADPEIHLAAIRELATTGQPSAAFALIAVLEDPDFPHRPDAARALAVAPHRAAIGPLLAAMDDADPELRAQAALALGRIVFAHVAAVDAFDRVSERLGDALARDPSPAVRFAAFDALFAIGRWEAFRLSARDGDPLVICERLRYRAYVASLTGRPDALRAVRSQARRILEARASDPAPSLPSRALDRWRYQGVVSESSPCPDTPVAAVHALDHLGDRSVAPLLAGLARSASDPPLRAAAVLALRRRGGDAAFEAAVRALDDGRWSVRRSGIEALGELDEPRAQALLASRLALGSPLERQASALALAKIPARSAALVAAFGDPVVQVRVAAEEALLARPKQVERLEEALAEDAAGELDVAASPVSEESRVERRRETEDSLARWRSEAAAAGQALAAALSAPDERVRHRAARVLASYPGADSLALLLEALRGGQTPAATSAAFALGLRGDAAARPALERAAGAGEPGLALASRRALQDLGVSTSAPERR